MNSRKLFLISVLAGALSASADTVLIDEDFNNDYNKTFAHLYDADGRQPHQSIASLFYSNSAGTTMPWWIVRDSNESKDKFMASHSYYLTPSQSNDWLISMPIDIPTEGFVLEFDAQCVNVRGLEFISDLSLYITTEIIDPLNMPTTPTKVYEKVPYGDDPDTCEGDWTRYSFPLDEYAGQTIFVNFVNQNTNKDILCLDNVRIIRYDPVVLSLDCQTITAEETPRVNVSMTVAAEDGIDSGELSLYVNGEKSTSWPITEPMIKGQVLSVDADIEVPAGEESNISVEFTTPGKPAVVASSDMTRLLFPTTHRVFFEETTSLHCGNCPMGMYTIESLLDDEELGEYVVPVSVHISAMGYDPMATDSYYPYLPLNTSAPVVFVERNTTYDGFIPAYDSNYDPKNEKSFAYRIAQRHALPALVDVDLQAQWVTEGADTTSIVCKATVLPATNLKDKEYRVTFILTENNVGKDNSPYWLQDNYLSGTEVTSRCGGWCDLPQYVLNARYHDVARYISAYYGHQNSLPKQMEAGKEYEYSYTMPIPNTEQVSNGVRLSEKINTEFCEVTAVVLDVETGLAVNAVRVPMSPNANNRYTTEMLVEALGITDVTVDSYDSEDNATYYDLTGRPTDSPKSGLYIRVTPNSAKKVVR